MMADIWNVKVRIPKQLDEAGSMGAAVLAGVGAGVYQDVSAIHQYLAFQGEREPDPQSVQKYLEYKEQFEAFYQRWLRYITSGKCKKRLKERKN